MRWPVLHSSAAALAVALLACGDAPRDPRVSVTYDPPADPAPRALLRADTVPVQGGAWWIDADIMMPPGPIGVAQATLQHVIDSVAAADTLAVAVRVTGFVIGPIDPETQSADLEPALRGVWGPPDSTWAVGSRRRTYRTHFTVLRPFEVAPGRPGQ
jgi:hypothetical protein